MGMKLTPLTDLRGTFVLTLPFVANPNRLYTCIALRMFRELIDNNENIYQKYYEPVGLTVADYQNDLAANATLCVLYSDQGEVINVPDTYIASFPNQSVPNYGNYVVSALLGPMSLDTDLSFLKQSVSEVISNTTGVEPTVYVDILSNNTVLTPEEASALEDARQGAISNRKTTYALLLESQALVAALTMEVKVLQDLLAEQPPKP